MRLAFRWPLRWYPFHGRYGMPVATRARVFAWARRAGFAGAELSVAHLDLFRMTDTELDGLRAELDTHGLAAAAVNPGGYNYTEPSTRAQHLARMERAAEIAHRLGARIVNTTFPGRRGCAPHERLPEGWTIGGRTSTGSSQSATAEEIAQTASALAHMADAAAKLDITISVELHQNCYADNSTSMLRLIELAGRPNVGPNPDMGNLLWSYATPEEGFEEAILRLAPRAVYVHAKNLRRVYVPELDRAAFIRTTLLSDGDIDWRFCLAALAAAGYDGWLCFEGDIQEGWDFQWAMQRNAAYVQSVLADLRADAASESSQRSG